MKVFLDTNVLVSAFVARGLCADLFRIIVAEHELLISDYVLNEQANVLEQKISLPKNQIDDIIKYLKFFSVTKNYTPFVDIHLRDKDDIPVISGALNSGAKYLITGDKDLLKEDEIYNIKIIDPKQFLRIIKIK